MKDLAHRLSKAPDENFEFDLNGEEDPSELFPALGVAPAEMLRNRQFYAVEYIVYNAKEWRNKAKVMTVFKRLKENEQTQIRKLSRKIWEHRSQWTWDKLSSTIAQDQRFYREALIAGPTAAGLVETRLGRDELLVDKYGFSKATGRRIYNTYNTQLAWALGEGVVAEKRMRAYLKKIGYIDARDRFPGRPIEKFLIDKSPRERKRFSDLGIHLFAHALRNLQNWRYGKRDIPWTPYACMKSCLDLQQRLPPRPPSAS